MLVSEDEEEVTEALGCVFVYDNNDNDGDGILLYGEEESRGNNKEGKLDNVEELFSNSCNNWVKSGKVSKRLLFDIDEGTLLMVEEAEADSVPLTFLLLSGSTDVVVGVEDSTNNEGRDVPSIKEEEETEVLGIIMGNDDVDCVDRRYGRVPLGDPIGGLGEFLSKPGGTDIGRTFPPLLFVIKLCAGFMAAEKWIIRIA